MRVLDVFAGIGGMSLGLEWAGARIVGQIEIEESCQETLKRNFAVPTWRDIRHVTATDIRRACGAIDLICGGFPCQDISTAGKGKGIADGDRSGLWREMWRLIRALRPTWVLVENVPALRVRGSDGILSALDAIGYTCWPVVVGAWAVGAPHKRDRVWIMAHNVRVWERGSYWKGKRWMRAGDSGKTSTTAEGWEGSSESIADTDSHAQCSLTSETRDRLVEAEQIVTQSLCDGSESRIDANRQASIVANSSGERRQQKPRGSFGNERENGQEIDNQLVGISKSYTGGVANTKERRCQTSGKAVGAQSTFTKLANYGVDRWPAAPGLPQHRWECPRMIGNKLNPDWVEQLQGYPVGWTAGMKPKDRLKALGNAVVPQVVEVIGRAIMVADRQMRQGGLIKWQA